LKVWGALLVLLWCGAGWAQGLPGLGSGGHRVPVDVGVKPWRILGRVQTELGGRCTGFVVAPSVVETAAHCLWIARTGHYLRPEHVHFLLGYERGRFRAHAVGVRVVIAAGYDPGREGATAGFDRAVVVLDRAVMGEGEVLPVVRARVGQVAMVGGYQQDRDKVALANAGCRVLVVGDLVRHDCAATRGASGSPLLVRGADGGWGIGGVVVLAEMGIGGYAAALPVMNP